MTLNINWGLNGYPPEYAVKWVGLVQYIRQVTDREGLLFIFLIIKSASFLIFKLRNLQIYQIKLLNTRK